MKSIRTLSDKNKKAFLYAWRVTWLVVLGFVWWKWNELPWYIFFPLSLFIALFDPGIGDSIVDLIKRKEGK